MPPHVKFGTEPLLPEIDSEEDAPQIKHASSTPLRPSERQPPVIDKSLSMSKLDRQISEHRRMLGTLIQTPHRLDAHVAMACNLSKNYVRSIGHAGTRDVSDAPYICKDLPPGAKECPRRWICIATLVAGAACSSLGAVLVGLDVMPNGEPVPATAILMIRAVMSSFVSILVCRKDSLPVIPAVVREGEVKRDGHLVLPGTVLLMFVNGFISFFVSGTFYFALARLPVAVALVVTFSDPFFCGIFGHLFLGEVFHGRKVAITSLGIVGAIISVAPWRACSSHLDVAGLVSACLNSVLQGLKFPFSRKAAQGGAHWAQQTFACGVAILTTSAIVAVLATAYGRDGAIFEELNTWTAAVSVCITLCSFAAQACCNIGAACVPACMGAVISQLCLVFAVLWGMLLLGQMPTMPNLLGAAVLIVAGLLMVFLGK